MGELWGIIQAHLDRYGVTEAAFARRMGAPAQTLNGWKIQGLRRLPGRGLLEAVARETSTPYAEVLAAALVDIGYMSNAVSGGPEPEPQAEPDAVVAPRSAPHSTPVTPTDIAAGVGLPQAEPGHRRSKRSSDTTARRHTS